jgi:hypothetical protein
MNPVTIDGKWTSPEEWSDALETPLYKSFDSKLNGTAYFYTKHDGDYIYALIDFISDTSKDANDGAGICFDTNHDGGSLANPDDYAFWFYWTTETASKFFMWKGTGSGWQKTDARIAELVPVPGSQAASSLDASPRSSSPHMIYEFRVPKAIFAGGSSVVGFAVSAWHNPYGTRPIEVLLVWPKDTWRDIPAMWGELAFSAVPIPELPAPGLGAVSMIALAASLLASRRLWRPRRRG